MKFLLLLLFSFSITTFGQSIEETEDWIEIQFINYVKKYTYNDILDTTTDGVLVLKDGRLYYRHDLFGGRYTTSVKIKDIKEFGIWYEGGTEGGWARVDIKFDKGKMILKEKGELEYKEAPEWGEFDMRLEPVILENGMKERLEKAITHLIKLYGGSSNIIKEPF